MIVLAVLSAVYGAVVESLGGDAPVLSLTKGLDPATGARLSTPAGAGRSRFSRGRTSRRDPRDLRPQQ